MINYQMIPSDSYYSLVNRTHKLKRVLSVLIVGSCIGVGLSGGSVQAQTTQPGQQCMTDASGISGCTANDVSLGRAIPNTIQITDQCDGTAGDTATFSATFEIVTTAQTRYDVGIWFAEDGDPNGDGAYTGKCSVTTPAVGAFNDAMQSANDGDSCGETKSGTTTQDLTITVQCNDPDGNGKLNIPYCTSWHQNGNPSCTQPGEAVPGAPSKCSCDPGFEVDVPVPTSGTIQIIKEVESSNVTVTDNFTLTVKDPDGNSVNTTNVGSNGGNTPIVQVNTGLIIGGTPPAGIEYTIGENDPGGGYSTSISCVNDDGPVANAPSNPTTVLVGPDENLVCTITNKLLPVCGDGAINQNNEQCDGMDINYLSGVPQQFQSCDQANCKITVAPFCGDNVVNGTEQCDGMDINYLSGVPQQFQSCDQASCKITVAPYCGDNVLNGTEACDGNDFGGISYPTGTTCSASCEVIRGPECGDGIVNQAPGIEQCDGMDIEYLSGVPQQFQSCDQTSCKITVAPYCGDGQINGTEQCDGGADCDANCNIIVKNLYPTRTQGYWKTHPDAVKTVAGSISFCGNTYSTTGKAYCQLFTKKGKLGNFYRQAAAAYLNCEYWGCPSEVIHAIESCDSRNASYLDRYNNGIDGVSAHGVEQPAGHGRANPKYCRR